jgi:hypothetical protein
VALGFELCGEAGVGLLLFEDRQGEPLGAPVPVPRAAARLSWNSPAVGGVEVEPYGRVAVALGRVELRSDLNGNRDLSPVLADVGALVRFGAGKSHDEAIQPAR